MNIHNHSAPDATRQVPTRDEIEAARLLLTRVGLFPAELARTSHVPTFASYIPVVAAAVSHGTARTYRPYWDRVADRWGHRRLDEPSPTEIGQLAEEVKANIVVRRNGRGGRSAVELFVAALRCLYNHAVADGLLDDADNPAIKVKKPSRLPASRFALPASQLLKINRVASTTGDDPSLDSLLLRFHTETACRRGGALSLRSPDDLDRDQCLVRLHEKGGITRWQPVSPTLMVHLQRHAEQRPAVPGTAVFRYRTGRPITRRRYDYLWKRLGHHLPWVATQQISIHWLRHTTLTWIERNFGYAVARAYAGHSDRSGATETTTAYVRAGIREVATALAALTGEPHPLALTATGGL